MSDQGKEQFFNLTNHSFDPPKHQKEKKITSRYINNEIESKDWTMRNHRKSKIEFRIWERTKAWASIAYHGSFPSAGPSMKRRKRRNGAAAFSWYKTLTLGFGHTYLGWAGPVSAQHGLNLFVCVISPSSLFLGKYSPFFNTKKKTKILKIYLKL